MAKKVLLQSPTFLGDEVVFTGVVRELHHETGWELVVKTGAPQLWQGHPGIAGVNPEHVPPDTLVVPQHHCPPFRKMGQVPVHFLEQYLCNIRSALGLPGRGRVRKFAGELPVSEEEESSPPLSLNTRFRMQIP
jgi:hypothetical protein